MFIGFGILGQRPGQDDRLSEDEWSEGMLWLCRRQELRLAGDQLLQWTKEMERKPRKIARLGSCIIFYTRIVLPSTWPRYAPMNW